MYIFEFENYNFLIKRDVTRHKIKKRLRKKNANIRKQLNRHRNSPKRRIVGDLGVEYQRGVAQESIQTKISPTPINQEKV